MTEKELKKLTRKQLLELLLVQTSRADALEAELAVAREELEKREIMEMEAGSIAEAALKLNGVFEAAEAAAAQYLLNIKRLSKQLEYRAMEANTTTTTVHSNARDAEKQSAFSANTAGWFNILLSDNTNTIVDDEN